MKARHSKQVRVIWDAATASNVPSGSLAVVYVNTDGSFAWSKHDVDRMSGVLGISESGNPAFAKFARIFAVEPGAAKVSEVPDDIRARRSHGHHDSIIYCDQSDWPTVEKVVLDAGLDPDWFIAAPGKSLAECRQLESKIKHKKPVLVQNVWTDGYDRSVELSHIDFTPPSHFHATG